MSSGKITTYINDDKAKLIKQEQQRARRKQIVMNAELTHISPTSMLFNALNVASTELTRLNKMAQQGTLNMNDMKKYAILINSLCKLSEENRLVKEQSLLEGLSDEEIKVKVLEALEVVAVEEDNE